MDFGGSALQTRINLKMESLTGAGDFGPAFAEPPTFATLSFKIFEAIDAVECGGFVLAMVSGAATRSGKALQFYLNAP